jgi:hypothetical protein
MTILCGMIYVVCLVLIFFGVAYALFCEGRIGYQPTRDPSSHERPPIPQGGSGESGRKEYRVDTSD